MDVLEHLPHPQQIIEKVRHWLASQGYVLIRGPLVNDPVAKLKEGLRRIEEKRNAFPGTP